MNIKGLLERTDLSLVRTRKIEKVLVAAIILTVPFLMFCVSVCSFVFSGAFDAPWYPLYKTLMNVFSQIAFYLSHLKLPILFVGFLHFGKKSAVKITLLSAAVDILIVISTLYMFMPSQNQLGGNLIITFVYSILLSQRITLVILLAIAFVLPALLKNESNMIKASIKTAGVVYISAAVIRLVGEINDWARWNASHFSELGISPSFNYMRFVYAFVYSVVPVIIYFILFFLMSLVFSQPPFQNGIKNIFKKEVKPNLE